MKNLAEWRENAVQFLSSHKKYRVFGPTLLDELHCRNEDKPDYIKIGIIYTPIIALSAGLISFAITRRIRFAASIASGFIVLGIVTTLIVDYTLTRRKGEEISEEECVKLLKSLEKMPKHWWWPWSQEIKDTVDSKQVDALYIERLRHLYNYRKLGGKIMLGFCVFGVLCSKVKKPGLSSEEIVETAEEAYGGERIEERSKIDRLIRTIYKVENKEMSLMQALEECNYKWVLRYFDQSLAGVKNQTKSEEEHNKYVEEVIKELQKLSLKYHPDKQESKDDQTQKMINQTVRALRNIHGYVMKMGKDNVIQKSLSGYIKGKECHFVYRMYSEIPLNILTSDHDVSGIVKISPVDGMSALFELYSLAHQAEGYLMVARNEYLNEAVAFIKVILKVQKIKGAYSYRSLCDIENNVEFSWKKFNEAYDTYIRGYYKCWVEYLESLNGRCEKSQLLELIQPEVEKLLKESGEQYEILLKRSHCTSADEEFVLPMLEYHNLIKTYYEFAKQLLKESKNCYPLVGWIGGIDQTGLSEINFILKQENNILINTKSNIQNHLYCKELLSDVAGLVNAYIKNDTNELKEKISKYYREDDEQKKRKVTKEVGGHVILFMLEHIRGLLSNKFKKKKTYFEKNTEELKQIREQRISAEQRAERLAIENATIKSFRNLKKKSLDSALRDIVEDSEDEIVEAVVQHVMEHNSSPEQVLDSIIEEIKCNKTQVLREGTVNAELIKLGIESFLNQGSSLSNVSILQDVNVNHVAQGSGMSRNP